MRIEETEPKLRILRISVIDDDWDTLSPADAKRIATLVLTARRFEETILSLDKLGLVHGPAHSSLGQEGGAGGSIAALARETLINGTHRAHHQAAAKAVNALYELGFDPTCGLSTKMHAEIRGLMHEILGLKEGWTGGRGGSMHLRRAELGIMGTNAIVAGGLPIACGIAFAEKLAGRTAPVVTYFGDGAVHQGTTHEAMNLAALYRLPVLFFIENNRYAVSMSIEQSTFEQNLLTRPIAHGIPAIHCDGMDPLAVWLATRHAAQIMKETDGPACIEADVYRYYHQSTAIPGSAYGYRTREEEDAWRARSPWEHLRAKLIEHHILPEADLDAIDLGVCAAIKAARDSCITGKGSASRIRETLWPNPGTVDDHITSDGSEFANLRFAEAEDFADADTAETSYIEAVPRVMAKAMQADPTILVMGEDVANLGGGTVGATRGLIDRFEGRIINTPITENGFCGMAVGMAQNGLRPVVELMYSDFFMVAADQLLNQAGKIRHLFNNTAQIPLVLRVRVPGIEGYGSQHSMDPAGIFAHFPGWHILAPSNAFDYVGLMNTALRCNDPVLMIEPQALHRTQTALPSSLNYYIPLRCAKRVRVGNTLTLLTTLTMVKTCQDVADEMNADAEVIDLRSLAPRDIDWETIGRSIKKTGRIAIVEQTTRGSSFGAWLSDEIQRQYFDHLDQPVQRLTGPWAPPVVSKALERAAYASVNDVRDLIARMYDESGLSLPILKAAQ
jgi:2-oxoisovalerate dehydrogenase E1 component